MRSLGVGIQLGLFVGGFIASVLGVGLYRKWSYRRELFDLPNERSSHTIPTPRGGGLVIVVVCLALYLIIGPVLGFRFSWGYFAGAILVAFVSWLDDLYSLPFWSRLIVHIGAAAILIVDVGFWSQLHVPLLSSMFSVGSVLGIVITIVWIAWLINAYNFMDGIDGIAALQAIVAGVGWAVLAAFFDLDSTFLLAGSVAAASAGFLVHNWQPARIFMGDVGSAFLGFTLAAIPLMARSEAGREIAILPFAGVLFVWFFIFDTMFTLIRRVIARKKVWQAHREHIYQQLIIAGWSHAPVALIYNSAALLLIVLVLLAVILSGIFPVLAFLCFAALTLLTTYVGLRRKGVDLSN